jgi:hypothetical protein
MPIKVACSGCKKRYAVPDNLRGKEVHCPGCGQPIAVPLTTAKATPPPLGASSLLDLMETEKVARPPVADAAPIPPWHRKKTPPKALWMVLGGLTLLLLIILIAASLKGGCQSQTVQQPSSTGAAKAE